MIVTIANQKGGTGKTTLATNLAGLYAAAGRRVVLADSDPQASAWHWGQIRPAHVVPVPVIVSPQEAGPLRHVLRELVESARYEVILLDTGGRISPGVRQAVALADFVLVPTLPSLPDIRSTEMFYQQVLGQVARERPLYGAVVLNGMQPRTRLAQDAETYMRQTTLPTFRATLRQYQSVREAFSRGLTVQEVAPGSNAAGDMQAVYDELQEEERHG